MSPWANSAVAEALLQQYYYTPFMGERCIVLRRLICPRPDLVLSCEVVPPQLHLPTHLALQLVYFGIPTVCISPCHFLVCSSQLSQTSYISIKFQFHQQLRLHVKVFTPHALLRKLFLIHPLFLGRGMGREEKGR